MKPSIYVVQIEYTNQPPIMATTDIDDAFRIARTFNMAGDRSVIVLEYTPGQVGTPLQLEIPK